MSGRGDAGQLAAAAAEVEAGRAPVAVTRPGHKLVVLVSAERWQRLEELASAGATAWWRRDAPGLLTQGRSRGRGRRAPVWMGPGSGIILSVFLRLPAAIAIPAALGLLGLLYALRKLLIPSTLRELIAGQARRAWRKVTGSENNLPS